MMSFHLVILIFGLSTCSAFLNPLMRRVQPLHLCKSPFSQMTKLSMTATEIPVSDLSTIGNDIFVPPSDGKIVKIVMKFGGSSLQSADRITYVAKLIKKHVEAGYKPVIVCSAMGKTTNSLLNAGEFALGGQVHVDSLRTLHLTTATALGLSESTHQSLNELLDEVAKLLEGVRYIGELTARTQDTLVSFGERMSVRMMAGALNKMGVPAQAFDAWTLGMRTSSEFGNADVHEDSYELIKNTLGRLDPFIVPVVTGFIGHDSKGRITTLGRGGSDLTATVIGAAGSLDEVQVWKDVDGIMTADPKLVKGAIPVTDVTYDEAAELAYFGAQVLHPISMQPAIRSSIPVRVKNSYNPASVGTAITASRDKSNTLVTAITSKNNVQLIDIVSTRMLGQYGFLAKVFEAFEDCKVSVDVIASSEVSLSMTLDSKQLGKDIPTLLSKLREVSAVEVLDKRAIVTLISNLDRASEVLSIAFTVLQRLGITCEMFSQGASKVNISLVVKMDDKDRVIKGLHACFFEGVSFDDLARQT